MLPLLTVGLFHLTSHAAAPSIPEAVKTELSKYASLDRISIYWKGTRTHYAPSQEFAITSSYLRQDHRFSWTRIDKKMSDKARKHGNGSEFKLTCKFDGDVVSATHGENDASWYKLANLLKKQPKSNRFDVPYFDAVGIYCPTQQEDFAEAAMRSNILYLIQNGGKLVSCEETQLEQETVIRIEIIAENPAWEEIVGNEQNEMEYEKTRLKNKNISKKKFDEVMKTIEERKKNIPHQFRWVYYLSPKHQFAVCNHDRLTLDGKVAVSYSNSSFQSIPGTNIVLAGRMKRSSFERRGEYSYELRTTPVEITDLFLVTASTDKIPQERFVLTKDEVIPGATVIDAVSPELQRPDGTVITYDMPASPNELDTVIAQATGKFKMDNKRNYIRYGCIIATLAFIIFATYRIYSTRIKGA